MTKTRFANNTPRYAWILVSYTLYHSLMFFPLAFYITRKKTVEHKYKLLKKMNAVLRQVKPRSGYVYLAK